MILEKFPRKRQQKHNTIIFFPSIFQEVSGPRGVASPKFSIAIKVRVLDAKVIDRIIWQGLLTQRRWKSSTIPKLITEYGNTSKG